MNSVSPKKANKKGIEKEGAGKGIVLFCCALFLTFQIAAFFFSSFSPVSNPGQLIVVSPQSLRLAAGSSTSDSQSVSSGTYHFSPFFFEPIAINYCDKSLLMSIRGIGPSLAESILTTREKIGGFKTAEDLLLTKGIGPSRLLQFTPYFNFTNDSEKN